MRKRSFVWILLCLLLATGVCLLWLHETVGTARRAVRTGIPARSPYPTVAQAPRLKILSTNNVQAAAAARARAGQFHYRLSNTTKTIGELTGDPHAILLENALIDTDAKLNLSIPKNLQAAGEPGAYIVQATGPIDNAFRAMLAQSGAQIVSYIPNDAYLVNISGNGANLLAGNPMTQAVIPYEPYYKISASMPVTIEQKTSAWTPNQTPSAARTTLLALAVAQKPLPAGTALTLGLYNTSATATVAQLEKLGGQIVARENSPFGPVVRVQPPTDWVALARLPGVQLVEPAYRRGTANDLSRATVGVAADTQTPTNYAGLTGNNVLVEVNDTGIDAMHPDLIGRIIPDSALSLMDTNGHGTHVAGIIAGDGTESTTVTNAQGSIMPGTNGQFRGMAPAAKLYSVAAIDNTFSVVNFGDQYLQAAPALTNALISNNSWNYIDDNSYDLAAASYDAAVRDALPLVTGSQPVLFVFSAGNNGGGDDTTDPGAGTPDSIWSPATAKDVITVGSIQEFRNITNEVTNVDGTIGTPWKDQTDTSYRVAGFSSRGNVGIGTEGTLGRYKPDVVAPGTSIISTRSEQWDIGTYFYQSPTNFDLVDFSTIIPAGSLAADTFPFVHTNTVQVTIQLFPSLVPVGDLPIFYGLLTSPVYTFISTNGMVSIPPDNGLTMGDIFSSEDPFTGAFNYAISNSTVEPVNLDIEFDTVTTNNPGNYQLVYSNLDQSLGSPNPSSTGPGPYYRYETGTSMSAADVSGVLALMQDYFTNALKMTPSPALLKAMLINGARSTFASYYNFQAQNASINFEGWGLINLPASLPPGVTNVISAGCSSFFVDQSPTNALATGDSHTYLVTVSTNAQQAQLPLRVTLVWTDPPGDPAAAIKLVNNLDLVVSNADSSPSPVLFYGNDIQSGIYNQPEGTNVPPVLDNINNVENVFISKPLGTNYYITVVGRDVNVNAVTAQTNTAAGVYAPNVVQDYALVVSCGEGEVTNAFTVTDVGTGLGIFSNPTTGQQVNFLGPTSSPLLNQFAGASSPLLGTNTVPIGPILGLDANGMVITNYPSFAANAIVTIGMTNQWHFYVITNPPGGAADVTNAGFITFLPDTLSIPRMGVFAGSTANATTPEADIDLYVASGPNASGLTNLDPNVISNCVHGTQVGLSAGGVFNGASLSRGGTEFVVDIGSHPGQVYYVGVKSERQVASEYDFLPIFTSTPFSQMQNGNQVVNGQLVPVNIPDARSAAHPGIAYIFGLAIFPMEVNQVVANDTIVHNNYGDLIGTLNHNGVRTVLNNHDILNNSSNTYTFLYDDSGSGNSSGSRPSDGPGSLQDFAGTQGIGPWMLAEVDTSPTQTGYVSNYNLTITPHQDATKGINVILQPGQSFIDFIDVPVGNTSFTVFATNLPPTISNPPMELFVEQVPNVIPPLPPPTDTNELGPALLNNGTIPGPGNSISVGPPLTPGRYWYRVFNPLGNPVATQVNLYIFAKLNFSPSAISTVNYASGGPAPIFDDAVTTYAMSVANTDLIQDFSVGLRVDHPRISDLVFHLISPDGTRYLLMENRGGTTTNGCGATIVNNFFSPASSSGGPQPSTNIVDTGETSGTLLINYNFFPVPDTMDIYYAGTHIFSSGPTSNAGTFTVSYGPGSSTLVTIVMNQGGNTNPATFWTYTASGSQTNFLYLAFTEDTNLTTTPIKFAPPPFVPSFFSFSTNFSDFESVTATDYFAGQTFGGWTVVSNQVTVVNDPPNAQAGNQFLALASGTITNTLTTMPGVTYTLSYGYRGPGIVSWWRGESNANDALGVNNGTLMGTGGYAAGEVGLGFNFVNYGDYVTNPPSASLNVGAGGALTLEAWINPVSVVAAQPIFDWVNDGVEHGIHLYISASGSANLYANLIDTGNVSHRAVSANGIVQPGVFQHVAVTYNQSSGICNLYYNGAVVLSTNLGSFTPKTTTGLTLGERTDNSEHFVGVIDEASVYNRALSDSEIQAIYQKGAAGKFDPNPEITAPQNLAEATVAIPGVSSSVILGANTTWQTGGATFTATGSQTPLVITGVEPGMLLDNFSLSASSGGNNLYYQPEEPMDGSNGKEGLNNQSAFGTWTLEVQDDRAGAANGTLLSWQLEFEFANTNNIPIILPGPGPGVIPPGGILYFPVNVPANADMATNILVFSTGPKNIWYDTNNPPTTNIFLFGGFNGSFILSATGSAPTNLVPGSTYYIVEQNTNSYTITNDFVVNFHLVAGLSTPYAFTQPAYAVTGTSAQLNGMATPNGLPATAFFQWGTSTAYGNQTPPVSVGTGTNVVYVANTLNGLLPNVPYHFRLVVTNALGTTYGFDQILDEANVVAWGANYLGQAAVPAGLSNMVAVAGAYDHSLALNNNETAVAWGDNTFGQATVPASLSNLVLAVAGGAYYSMALVNNGTVASWGANILSQTNVPAGLNNVIEIAGGTYSSLALQNSGAVVAWGAGFFNLTNVPVGLGNVVAIAGGSYHNLAIRNDGTVTAWGDDSANQTNVPAGLTNAVAIAGGSYHSLALKYDGTVVAWGDDSAGQIDVPAGLNNVVAIAAGGFHSLALKSDGTIVAWGDNSSGQRNVPSGLTNFVAIAAGNFQSLALTPQSIASLTNIVLNLTNGVPLTNSIVPGGIVYYQVNVPANADFATNLLLFTQNGPLNIWFSTNTPPTTNVFLFSGTNGTYTLSTNSTPPLVPGSTYYLGVQNTNNVAVTYGIEVDFHLTAAPPIVISGIIATNGGFLLIWYAPTNDIFLVQQTGNLLPPQTWNTFSNIVTYPGPPPPMTNGIGQFRFFDDGSQFAFGPMRFYRLLLVNTLTAGGPQTNTVPSGNIDYYLIHVPANADLATNLLLSASGPVNLWFNPTNPPAGANPPDDLLLGGATSGFSVLSTTSVPTNIVPGGTYWLGVQNTNGFAVTYGIEVNFHLQAVSPGSISGLTITYTTNSLGTNGFLLAWFAPTNDVFQVQRTDTLLPQNWLFFTNFISYTGPPPPVTNGIGQFRFFDDGSQTPPGLPLTRFYRILFAGTLPSTHTNVVFISSITSTNISSTNGFWLTWSAPTNYLFEVKWTTNLVPVVTWQTFPNVIAYSTLVSPTNSLFNFFDNGAQGGLGPIKFYQLIVLP